MANLYVADDGTIHDRDIGGCQRVGSQDTPFHTYDYAIHSVGTGRKIAFWFITIAISVLIGYLLYSTIGVKVFERESNPNELVEYIGNFFCIIAPFAIVGGALACAILYGVKCAANHDYNLGTYFLSALSATGGTVGVGLSLFLLTFIVTIAIYILLVVIVIAIIIAVLEGS